MDIVVTIPKNRLAEVIAEEEQAEKLRKQGVQVGFFWGLSRKPRYLRIGDRVYFVWNRAIRSWHEVVGFGADLKCTTTGILYPGFCVQLNVAEHEITPIPMKGFRGFQYYERPETSKGRRRDDPAVEPVPRRR